MVKFTDVIDFRLCQVDKKLWHKFKALCHKEHLSMNQAIKDLVREAVDRRFIARYKKKG